MQVVLEPTSVYHEVFATGLHEAGVRVSVVNPAKVRKFAEGIGLMHKNDSIDALILARYGVQAQPPQWQPEPPEIRHLKALLARLNTLDQDIRREQNRMEKTYSADLTPMVTESIEDSLDFLKNEKKRFEKALDDHIQNHPGLKKDRQLLESIPGVGKVLSKYMIALLRGHHFDTANQVTAYVGLAPISSESGTSKKRSRLSKQGPALYRAKLYMPAVTGKTYNPDVRALYLRMLNNGKTKMAAVAAAMRKLLVICYGVLKHQTPYQPNVKNA